MRRTLPSDTTDWRTISPVVPDYIPVEVERGSAEVTITGGNFDASNFTPHLTSSYTVLDGRINVGSTLTTTSSNTTMMEISMEEIHMAQEAIEGVIEETIDDSELVEPEPVVKRKIVRRKKERPMFWKEEAVGERTTLPALMGEFCANLDREHSYEGRGIPKASSPFVNMIPLKILNNSFNMNYRTWSSYSSNGRRQSYNRNMADATNVDRAMLIADQNIGVSQVVNSMIFNGTLNTVNHDSFKRLLANNINWFIKDANIVDVAHYDNSASSFDHTSRAFLNGETMRINARTFSASLGQLTCFLETERYSRVFIPQVMAVILPENYVYQKEHVLLHGTIDLSKVVVLVNRELDDTEFHNKNFRAYYRKHLLPILNSLKVDVWKVPVSFMEENCFHGAITLEKTSFMEKKQELEGIYQGFRNQYYHIDLDPPPPSSEDDEDDDYDEDYDDEDDDY